MNANTPIPICEECDIPMQRYGGLKRNRYVEGWGCDDCGWSEDDDCYQEEYKEQEVFSKKQEEREYLFNEWKRLGYNVTDLGNIVQNEISFAQFQKDYYEWKRAIERVKERITAVERETVAYFEEGNL